MAINETIHKGRKYRHCIENTQGNKKWNRYSFWTAASDVEFNDGATAEQKMGSFKGVTTNEDQTAGYAADVTLVKSLKTSLSGLITSVSNLVNNINSRLGGLRFYEDADGKWVVGADSVPKKLGSGDIKTIVNLLQCTKIRNAEIDGHYGFITEFDLTVICSNYKNLIFGENIIATCGETYAGQAEFKYLNTLPINAQKNVNFTVDMNGATANNFKDYLIMAKIELPHNWNVPKATYFDKTTNTIIDFPAYSWLFYNASAGKLWTFTTTTSYFSMIGLYEI